jgi:integrase/recombinase XerD
MKPADFARHLTRFLGEYLPAHRNVSPNTVASYRDVFTLLLRYCQDRRRLSPDRLRLEQLSASRILEFLGHLETERLCTSRTRNQRLAAIHAFFRYLQSEAPDHLVQCQQILAIPLHRHERKAVPYLEAGDLAVLLAQPDRTTVEGRRHAVLLCVLYDTGARVQEVLDLRVGDVRIATPAQIRLTGKGRKMRIVPLMSETVTRLEEYLREHRLQDNARLDEPLFFNRYGQRLSRSGVRYLIAKYTEQARQQRSSLPAKISPHVLRHTKAMHLLQSGNPMPAIQAILGHADIRTCNIYASADLEMTRKALEKVAPVAPPTTAPSWRSNQQLMDWLRSL